MEEKDDSTVISSSDQSSESLASTHTSIATILTSSEEGIKLEQSQPTKGGSILCSICNQLGLSIENFIIPHEFQSASKDARGRSALGPLNANSVTAALRSGGSSKSLGSLGEILARSVSERGLIELSINERSAILDEAKCQLSWEVDGREFIDERTGDMRKRTRRLKVHWDHQLLRDCSAYLVLVAPEQHERPNSEAQATSRKSVHFLGRTINPRKGKTALIKSWLDLCRSHHGSQCFDRLESPEEFEKMLGESYFGVLDVVNMQLCVLPYKGSGDSFKHDPYVALSYVWGMPTADGDRYTTTRINILLHQNHGGLQAALQKLPKAVREAIDLVRQLGMRYIWIDSLCIVQDSFRSWNLNARKMHIIYGSASLTICAADGKDSSTGLEALNASSADQLTQEFTSEVTLMISRPPEAAIQASQWNRRAWTFQERLLSRRCLIFAEKRVYYQCRSASMSEDIYAQSRGAAWSLDSIHAPLQMLRELKIRSLWFYIRCVSLYTSRQLTKSSDILAAFNGVTSILAQVMRAPFVFGLPSSHFDLALLWQPAGTIPPPKRSLGGGEKVNVEFPTWAWCGWTDGQVNYLSDLLGDCLANVHEWLVNHTWICYYLRDAKGDLRPLWDTMKAEEDQSSDTRWRGYKARKGKFDAADPPSEDYVEKHSLHSEGSEASGVARFRPGAMSYGSDENRRQVREAEKFAERLDEHSNHGHYPKHAVPGHRVPILASDEEDRATRPNKAKKTVLMSHTRSRRHQSHASPRRRPRGHTDSSSSSSESERESDIEYVLMPVKPAKPAKPVKPVHGSARNFTKQENVAKDRPDLPRPLRGRDVGPEEQRRRRYEVNRNYRDTAPECYDLFGRAFWDETRLKSQNEFFRTVPENPFRVLKAPYSAGTDKDEAYQPKLQFWTWYQTLHILRPETPAPSPGNGLCRCDVADVLGDWCGTIVVREDWIQKQIDKQGDCVVTSNFIALSEAKSFSMEECPMWTYYIPKERHESEWDVFYVLLIEYVEEDAVWHRVALGKIFRAAFSFGDEGWKEIILG